MAAVTGPVRRGLGEEAGAGLTAMVGVVLLRLALSGLYLRFVRRGMLPFVVLAGVVFVALGVAGLVRAWRGRPAADAHDEPGAHHHGPPRVALLLLLPVLAVFLVSPASLGAFAADRTTRFETVFDGPPPPVVVGTDGIATLAIADYTGRLRTAAPGLDGVTVRLTGFASREKGLAGGFVLNRFAIACCAADARVAQVAVLGTGEPPPDGTWVEVTGTPDPGRPGEPAVLAQEMRVIPEPAEPYQG